MSERDGLRLVIELRDALRDSKRRIVLAESCTAGRVCATLAILPGISAQLCGGFVVYRNASKSQWLGVPDAMLEDASIGPVSEPTTLALAQAALAHTTEADVALAITGDIGPGASAQSDGVVYTVVSIRNAVKPSLRRHQLTSPAPVVIGASITSGASDGCQARLLRLEEATQLALSHAVEVLRSCPV